MSVEQGQRRQRITDPATVTEIRAALFSVRGRLGLRGEEGIRKIKNSGDALYRTPAVLQELRARNWGLEEAASIVLDVLECILIRQPAAELDELERAILCATLNLIGSRDDLGDRQRAFIASRTPRLTATMYKKEEAGAYYELARLLTRMQSYPCGVGQPGDVDFHEYERSRIQDELRSAFRQYQRLNPGLSFEEAFKDLVDLLSSGIKAAHHYNRLASPIRLVSKLIKVAIDQKYGAAVKKERKADPYVRLFSPNSMTHLFLNARVPGIQEEIYEQVKPELIAASFTPHGSDAGGIPVGWDEYQLTDDFALRLGSSIELLCAVIYDIEERGKWQYLIAKWIVEKPGNNMKFRRIYRGIKHKA
ncbi:hypothetical protein [Arthrobacter sp. 2MCAF14]|uniref:hypothetical protein n=1 Tax=Arthrobacter sp. 2MCAF14 TaxID=3232982 RepID=UPI003F923FEA